MSASIKLTFNHAEVRAKIRSACSDVTPILAEQVLKDSNFYAREDTGAMIASSQIHSNLKEGELIWETNYAKYAYYVGMPSHDKNPNATLMWFETAKTTYLKEWLKLAQKIFSSKV